MRSEIDGGSQFSGQDEWIWEGGNECSSDINRRENQIRIFNIMIKMEFKVKEVQET